MRYSIMVQVVSLMTVILMAAAALFAWLQTRTSPEASQKPTDVVPNLRLTNRYGELDPNTSQLPAQ